MVDLGCVLHESLAGFRAQVGDLRHGDADIVIIPGVGPLTEDDDRTVQRFLAGGATVLLEYSAGTRLSVDPYFPYVEYNWPLRVKIREFAPVLLGAVPGDEIIGTFLGKPVALRRRVDRGTLVVLGSPLGPVFLTGDPDARRWLERFLKRWTAQPRSSKISQPLDWLTG